MVKILTGTSNPLTIDTTNPNNALAVLDVSGGSIEFQVNTNTSSHQLLPSTTALADSGFVVTWASNGQDGSVYGI